jgi:DNA-binding winged helix-turn-helix (wHTH) protein
MWNLHRIMGYLLVFSLLFTDISFVKAADHSEISTRNTLLLRKIGDQFLRAIGDNSSRLLPVENEKEGSYHINFENQFAFLPDSLAQVVTRIGRTGELPDRYALIVTETKSGEIVYGFTSSDIKKGTVPCVGRALPKSNYTLAMFISPVTEGLMSNKASIILLASIFFVIVLFAGSLYYVRMNKRRLKTSLTATKNNAHLPGTIALGNYTFHPDRRLLIIDQERMVLTAKEFTLLKILTKKVNQVIDRSCLLKEGWEDEGVITGRSLDVYVSKLRKKLQKDPLIKITNFHGRGYALEVQMEELPGIH